MKDVLATRVLERFAASHPAVVLDYDGTLAPIVAEPRRAFMRPSTRDLLRQVAHRYPTAILTGRTRADVSRLLSGVDVAKIVGSHGSDWGRSTARMESLVSSWRAVVERSLRHVQGVTIEDKRCSLALHYRQSRNKRRARAAIAHSIRDLAGVRVVPGKLVINLLPERALHKGMALARLRQILDRRTAIYAGDDVTDEDVFALREPDVLAVRVGKSRDTQARFYIPRQRDIDRFLRALITARQT